MKKFISLFIIIVACLGLKANPPDEGMWVLPLIEKLNIGKMTELGLNSRLKIFIV